jgi:hypothetical protein
MLRDTSKEEVRAEAARLAGAFAGGRSVPRVKVRYTTGKFHCTGHCKTRRGEIVLSLPEGVSRPQALALVVHEVAHWLADPEAHHGEEWRSLVRACALAYEVHLDLDQLPCSKAALHAALRQGLALRLAEEQHAAHDPEPVATVVLQGERREVVLEKIRKLLALAAGADSEHEAGLAAARAARLLRVYRLDVSEVDEVDDTDPLVDAWVSIGVRRRSAWRVDLGFGLASVLGVYALSYTQGGRKDPSAHSGRDTASFRLFGRRSAVAVVSYLYHYLLREIDHLGKQAVRLAASPDSSQVLSYTLSGGGSARRYGRSFRLGAVAGVLVQLRSREAHREAARQAAAASACEERSLVLASRDYDRAKEWALDGLRVKVRGSLQLKGARDGGAFSQGKQAGRSIRLSAGVSGGQAQRRITDQKEETDV